MFNIISTKRFFLHLGLLCLVISLHNDRICYGYIMPAEQLVEFLTNNFLKIETVDAIVSATKQDITKGVEERISPIRILIKSPDLFKTITFDPGDSKDSFPDNIHLQLLVSNEKKRIELLLSWMGINLESLAFTRIDNIIAYRIGNSGPDIPKILIEKERFLPLQLVYRPPDKPSEIITVRFNDYRKLDEGWYPYEIISSFWNGIVFKYTVRIIRTNTDIDEYHLKPALIDLSQEEELGVIRENLIEEERLRRIIKAFEEKYE